MRSIKAVMLLLLMLFFTFTSNFSAIANNAVGVKKGDWIKYDMSSTSSRGYDTAAVWERIEILDVSGTNLTIRITDHRSDGEEVNLNSTGDIAKGGIDLWVIPANLAYGVSFNVSNFNPTTIDEESTKTYAGANRTVLHAYVTKPETPYSIATSYSVYWDKQTGVAVEICSFMRIPPTGYFEMLTCKATETNMWQAELDPTISYTLVAVATVIAAVAMVFVIRRKLS